MKDLSSTNKGRQLTKLGYTLFGRRKDFRGNIRKYATMPTSSAGSHCYFDSLSELSSYIRELQELRSMQAGKLTTAEKMHNERCMA